MTDAPRESYPDHAAARQIDLGYIGRNDATTNESFEPTDEALIFLNGENEQTCHVEGPNAKAMAQYIVDAVRAYGAVAQGVVSRGVSWSEEDYKHARDCMIGLLRGRAWTISEGSRGVDEFDNAFQHAVGILALTASPLASTEQK